MSHKCRMECFLWAQLFAYRTIFIVILRLFTFFTAKLE